MNDKMAEYTSTPGVTSLNAALMHTLQRHRDILQVTFLQSLFFKKAQRLFNAVQKTGGQIKKKERKKSTHLFNKDALNLSKVIK